MARSQFSLTWDEHKKNVCNGLSTLQQNGEFVDMTIAADGHMVKVHQVIIALASPYIKELISTAQCPHPVIFLNKISYTTLCSILEYIYTGEVLVSIEDLKELIDACKELHIKGLEDMKLHQAISTNQRVAPPVKVEEESLEDDICYFEIASPKENDNSSKTATFAHDMMNEMRSEDTEENLVLHYADDTEEMLQDSVETLTQEYNPKTDQTMVEETPATPPHEEKRRKLSSNVTAMQYTVSNQGSLQMILNRFVYYLKHTNRDSTRQWRCVDYLASGRCPAYVVTRNDVVLQRISAHHHEFHDKKILKKVRSGAIFTAIHEAEAEGQAKKSKTTAACDVPESE